MSCNGRRVATGWISWSVVISIFVFFCACSLVRNVCAEANFQTSTVSGLTSAYHIVSADFNNDTFPDLAVTQWSANQVTVLLGNGLGGFIPAATLITGGGPNFIAVGDFDNSGSLDMAITNGLAGHRNVTLLFNDGTGGSWSTSTLHIGDDADVSSLVAANFTSSTDTNLDLFIVKDSSVIADFYEIWQGDGAGSFAEITGASGGTGNLPIFVATADFNGDTKPDMVVANYSDNSLTVLLGNGDGTFSQASGSAVSVGFNPQTVATGNLNGDAHVDMVVANRGENSVTILLGRGDGTFENKGDFFVMSVPFSVVIADFDGDGLNDIAASRYDEDYILIFYGNGDGTFNGSSTKIHVGMDPAFIVAADFDRDGKTDLAVTNNGSNDVTILLNRTGVCLPPPADMVLWLSGDGHPFDLLGTSNGVMMNGATYGTGRVGRAFNLDGVDDYVEVDVGIDDFGTAPFTIDFWMYSRNDGNGTYIVGKSHPDGGLGWDMRLHNNTIQVVGLNGWGVNITSDASITRNAWHHIALASTDTTVTLYINGIVQGTSPRSAISSTTNPGRIGYTTNFGGTAFNGLIDETQLFNRALTAEEIMAIYNAGGMGACKPCFTPPSGMVSWWTGDGNTTDIIGVNDGTMMNGAAFAAGKISQAFSFDGDDDFVRIDSPVSIPVGNSPRTIGAWIKSTGQTSGNRYQGVVGYGTTNAGQAFYLERGGNSAGLDNNKLYYMNLATGGRGTTEMVFGEWYHVDYVYDGSTSRIYLNGQLEGAVSDLAVNTVMNAEGFMIGTVPTLDGWHANFRGLIDEPMVFNRALTAEEIAAIHAAGSAGVCIPPDTTPDQFTFNDQTNVALNSLIESNQITVAGIDAPSPISITGGEYSINNGAYTLLAGTVQNGQTVRVHQTSSSSYSTTTNATLTIGGVSDTFSITTMVQPDMTPDPFAFTDQTGVSLNTIVESDVITVTGINVSVAISITGGEYSINNGAYTLLAGTVQNGQTVRVRQTSSSSYSTTTNATLTIGGVSDTFSVTTIAPPEYTIVFSSSGNGTVLCSPATVILGGSSVCTITPDPGYLLAGLADNDTDVTDAVSGSIYTISNVTENHTVEAVFERFTFIPDNGTLGTVIQVSGSGFGIKKGKVYLEKDGVRYATKVKEWNIGGSNLIKATIHKAPPAGRYTLVLSSREIGEVSADTIFEVMAPEIDSVAVNLVEEKKIAMIEGDHFGTAKKPKVFMNNGTKDLSCKVLSFSGSQITCSPNKVVVTGRYTVKVTVGKVLVGEGVFDITVP